MKWLPFKPLLTMLSLVVFMGSSAHASTDRTKFNNCKLSSESESLFSTVERCLADANQFFDSEIAPKIETKLEALLEQQLSFATAVFGGVQESSTVQPEHYAEKIKRASVEQACGLVGEERAAHINRVVDNLMFSTQQRQAFINSVNSMLDQGSIC